MHPDVAKWLYDDIDTLDQRANDNLEFRSPEDKKELKKIVESWKGQTFGDFSASLLDQNMQDLTEGSFREENTDLQCCR